MPSMNSKERLLIHGCCAHCAAYTVSHFREVGYEIGVLWYNPNVHPYREYQARFEAIMQLSKVLEFSLTIAGDYDMVEFLRRVSGREEERCRYCFEMRLSRTAEFASRGGFDLFTTTLLISPHQKHDLLREIGERIGREKGVPFLYTDLRKRYSDSRHITKPLELYRQQYCGCIYSEWERYRS